MPRYLLTCACGKTLPVDIGQAGGKLACACGATLDVPPLRTLRHLPVEPSRELAARSTWGVRQQIFALACICATTLIGFGLWNWLNQPTPPKFDASDATLRTQIVDKNIDELTPAQAWRLSVDVYRPLAETGFTAFDEHLKPAILAEIARRQFIIKLLMIPSALCVLIAFAAAFWPNGQPRRPGGKETRR